MGGGAFALAPKAPLLPHCILYASEYNRGGKKKMMYVIIVIILLLLRKIYFNFIAFFLLLILFIHVPEKLSISF